MYTPSNYTKGPLELLGGPEAYAKVPMEQIDHKLSPGALTLLCVMRAWCRINHRRNHGPLDVVRTPPGGWHAIMGREQSQIPGWARELRKRGFIAGGTSGCWFIADADLTGRTYTNIRLRPLLDSSLSHKAKRLWIELHRYVDFDDWTTCRVSRARLAENLGVNVRNVGRARRDLEDAGYLETNGAPRSSIYRLDPSGGSLQEELIHRHNEIAPPSITKSPPPHNKTAPLTNRSINKKKKRNDSQGLQRLTLPNELQEALERARPAMQADPHKQAPDDNSQAPKNRSINTAKKRFGK